MKYEAGDNLDRQTELDNCNFVKTVLMLLVVFYHSILFWKGNWFTANPAVEVKALSILADWLNSFHIYAFALVSGYLFYYLKHERGKYQRFWPFVGNKLKRLMVPYVFVALVWVIPIQWWFFRFDGVTALKNFALALNPNQLWFLIMLFDVFVIVWLLSDFFAKHHLWGAVVVFGLYGVGLVGPSIVPNVFMVWRALTYVPLFWLGFKLRQSGMAYVRRIPAWVWLAADLAVFALTKWVIDPDASLVFKLLKLGLDFLLHIVGAVAAFAVLQKVASCVNGNTPFWKFFGKRSMVIYLFHQQVIYFFIFFLNGVVNPYVNALINFVGSVAISLLICGVLMKFKWTKYLIGEK
ncbi:MAG: acyltransferase [Clostridia bacterium]|nr:acyltransferase [Clostridia bacterium]